MKLSAIEANGATIPPLGIGTAWLDADTCARSVATAISAGVRLLDTAPRYGTEAAVAQGIRAAGIPRDQLFVTTKVYWTDLAAADLRRSAEDSLQRLGLDQIDLLLIHWPNPNIPLRQTMDALAGAKRSGLTRHIGLANFTPAMVEQAVNLSSEPLVANQCEYHPYLDQSALLAACRRHGLALMSYSPLRQAGPDSPLADPVIANIAAAKVATPAQIVLRWHLQQDRVVPLPRSSNPQRIRQNASLEHFALDAGQMAAITALHRPGGRKVNPPHAPIWD